MQTNTTPPGQMTQGQYHLTHPQQPGQISPGAMHQGPVNPGQIPQGQPGQMQQQYPEQHWNQAAQTEAQHYNRGYGQTAVGQQGYRTTQSQISPAAMTQAQAEQLQASRIQASRIQASQAQMRQGQIQQLQANQAAAQAAAIQHSPRGHLATAPNSRGQGSYGPTSPTQYLQRDTPPPAVTNRYAQPYGQQQQGQPQAIAATGAGWTGSQPAQHPGQRLVQRGPQSGLAHRSASVRRYRHEEDEDFAPNFGNPQAGGESWLLSLPVINWHNLPLGNMRFWTALGGIVFAAIMLNVLGTSPVISSIVKSRNRECQEVIQPNSVLSRQQLTQLIAVPERSPKANIHQIISEPYCLLPSLNIRAGVNAVREAYPLEFDPDTWIVVLYEGDEYAGYRFNAR